MNVFKRSISIILSVVLMIGLTSCSDVSWSVKSGNNSLSIGTYIFYMTEAYSKAYMKAEDKSSDILTQTIEEKTGSDYIKDEAIMSCKRLIALENIFDEMGLSITDTENKEAEEITNATWKSYGNSFEKLGIAKSSYHRAATVYSLKLSKIIDAKYGENGTEKLTDNDLKDYFIQNYISYSYFFKDLSEVSNKLGDMSEAEDVNAFEELSKDFKSYVDKIDQGASYASVVNEFESEYDVLENANVSGIENFDYTNKNSLPRDVVEEIKKLEPLKAKEYTASNYLLYLLYKYDINSELSFLKDEDNKASVKEELSYQKIDNLLKEKASNLEVEINQKAINKYPPSIISKI